MKMTNRTKSLLAKLALLSATLIWGSSFFIMKNTLEQIQTFYLLAFRFSAAAVLLAFIFIRRLKKINFSYLGQGAIMGALLFAAYSFQTYGLMGTTPGKNAFLTTVYCILVPFLYWAFQKARPNTFQILASVICVAGIGLVTFNEHFTVSWGDGLTLVCGLLYAAHIVVVAVFSREKDIIVLTVLQFMFSGLLAWVFGLIFNAFPASISPDAVVSLLYLCFLATAAALLLQNVGQKYTHASTASIILSLESVFGVLFSILFYGEQLTLKIGVGFVLILGAVLLSEVRPGDFLKKKD